MLNKNGEFLHENKIVHGFPNNSLYLASVKDDGSVVVQMSLYEDVYTKYQFRKLTIDGQVLASEILNVSHYDVYLEHYSKDYFVVHKRGKKDMHSYYEVYRYE